jgi:hypothetical protein
LEIGDVLANRMRELLAERLMALFLVNQRKDWLWFENVLAYDNARLSQALVQTGLATHMSAYVDVGLRSLRWLMSLQTTSSSCFRPVGSESFGRIHQKPNAFDQQPVEAWATISACIAAWRVSHDDEWSLEARRAFDWFLGKNDLQTMLVDPVTGSCSDGLHPDRVNENKGAESVLSYLLSVVEMRQFTAMTMAVASRAKLAPKISSSNGVGEIAARSPSGSIFVPIQILDSPEPLPSAGASKGRRQALQAGD